MHAYVGTINLPRKHENQEPKTMFNG